MFNTSYLGRLRYVPFEQFPGIYAITDHRDDESSRIVCTYADGQRHKEQLFRFMHAAGQLERPAEWDLHHIVEGHHYADIDFRGELEKMYKDVLPCVLIHSAEEHRLYTRIARTSATKELFRGSALNRNALERSKATLAEARNMTKRASLQRRVDDLGRFYQGLYSGDPVLQEIARCVLQEARLRL